MTLTLDKEQRQATFGEWFLCFLESCAHQAEKKERARKDSMKKLRIEKKEDRT